MIRKRPTKNRQQVETSLRKNGQVRKAPRPFDANAMKVYLEALAHHGMKVHAARECGVSLEVIRLERKKNQAFADMEEEAKGFYIERLEAEAFRRGHDGVDRPVFYKGKKIATVKEFSDRLLEMLLQGADPDKYRKGVQIDNNVNVAGVLVVGRRPSDAEWEAEAQQAQLPPVDGGDLVAHK